MSEIHLLDVNDVRVAELKMILNPTQQGGTISSSCKQFDSNPVGRHPAWQRASRSNADLRY